MLAAVKLLLRGALILVVLLVVLGAGVFLFFDRIVAASIEKGATYATGVETKVGGIDASPFAGSFSIDDLSVANPQGFRDEPFVNLASTRASWENGTILSDSIHVREFALDGVVVNLERTGGKTNYGTILDHVEKLSPPSGEPPAKSEESSGSSRELKIDRLVIRNVKTALHLSGIAGAAGSFQVEVPEIVIEDFNSRGSTGEIVAKLTRAVIEALLSSSLQAGRNVFPDDLLKDLGGQLEGLEKVLGDQAEGMLKDLDSGIGDAKKALKDVGGLFKGK
jgi:hypothetical protein